MTTSTPEFHNRRFIMRPTGSLCGLKSGRCQSWRRSRRRDKLQVHQGPYMANVLSDRARLPIRSLLFVAFVIVPTLVDGVGRGEPIFAALTYNGKAPSATRSARISGYALAEDYGELPLDRKSTRLNSSHGYISYAVFCLKKKNKARQS